jgi:hypothetical protein
MTTAQLRKMQSGRRRQLERERRQNEREWREWDKWLQKSAAAFGALRRARESGDVAEIRKARRQDSAVLRSMPPIPRGPKP